MNKAQKQKEELIRVYITAMLSTFIRILKNDQYLIISDINFSYIIV